MVTPSASSRSQPDHSFLERFGPTLLQGGITPIPSTLYRYQGALGLTAQEVWFVSYILMYRWDDALPYPSLIRMAADTGMSRRNLQRIKDSLVAKRVLVLIPRHTPEGRQDSNAYDFRPLFAQLEWCIREWGPKAEYRPHPTADMVEPSLMSPLSTVTAMSHPQALSPPPPPATPTAHPSVATLAQASVTESSQTTVTAPSQTTVTAASQTTMTAASQTTVAEPSHEEEPVRKETKEIEPSSEAGGGHPFSLTPDSTSPDPQHLEEDSSADSLTAAPYSLPTHGKHRGRLAQGPNGTLARESSSRANEQTGSAVVQPVEQPRAAPTNLRAGTGASSRPEPPDPQLNHLWQMTLLQLQQYTPNGTDLSKLRYVELRELDTARGWALLTVPNALLQAPLQQGPLHGYLRDTLSWLCQRPMNVAVVVTTREGPPALDMLLAQEAARSAAKAHVGDLQTREDDLAGVDNETERTPLPFTRTPAIQAKRSP